MRRTVVVGGAAAIAFGLSLAATGSAVAFGAGQTKPAPLAFGSARVTISGTSNIHPYTATTTSVEIRRAAFGSTQAGSAFWQDLQQPGGLDAFEIAIPAATLTSPKEGLDKNMHKALKVQQHAFITFRLTQLAPQGNGKLRATGTLGIAGAEREIALDVTTRATEDGLAIQGSADLLMTDFGITPPKAMLGMLKTDPKVTVTFDAALTVPLT